MQVLSLVIQILAAVAGCGAALLSLPLFFRFRWPAAAMWGLKVYVSALSPLLAGVGLLTTVAGAATGSFFVTGVGVFVTLVYAAHVVSVTRPPHAYTGFARAFGAGWEKMIRPEKKVHFLKSRRTLRLPAVPRARLEQNLVFATLPGTDRQLLCDVWLPPKEVRPSRLAFIYLHGSAFYFLDKDFGTRPLFGHLAAQGHVVMDVAYRLAPETDILGMVHDTKRAIAWLKEHARAYGIDPARVVVGGGSAGGTLALMAAYTAGDPQYTPAELLGKDLGTRAVVSLYGPTDLEALYYHTRQDRTTREVPGRPRKAAPSRAPAWLIKSVGKDYQRLGMDRGFESIGTLAPLLGGHPDECPGRYTQLSPTGHVHAGCPPTLLIHGEHDIMAPVLTTRSLYTQLVEEGVPTVLHILPQSDHGFDLVLPRLSPAAHNAIYDVERFLALVAVREGIVERKTAVSGEGKVQSARE